MFIRKEEYDKLNERLVNFAREEQRIIDIIDNEEKNKTPAVFIVDKIKEVIRRQN